jgi:hypothetical protein
MVLLKTVEGALFIIIGEVLLQIIFVNTSPFAHWQLGDVDDYVGLRS